MKVILKGPYFQNEGESRTFKSFSQISEMISKGDNLSSQVKVSILGNQYNNMKVNPLICCED